MKPKRFNKPWFKALFACLLTLSLGMILPVGLSAISVCLKSLGETLDELAEKMGMFSYFLKLRKFYSKHLNAWKKQNHTTGE